MQFIKVGSTLLSILIFTSCHNTEVKQPDPFTQRDYWNNQALNDILPLWTNHVVDSGHGSYYSTLDVNWKPVHDTVRFPSMMARHLFSYSVGYMMSGEESHLSMARGIKDYLLQHAWDEKYGGWYDALTPEGKVLQNSKSTFVQLYVITGLTLYYVVTHDPEVRSYIDQSNNLLEEKVWDHEQGGYFDNLNQDWTLKNEVKTISSQLAPSSGYLLYLYLATREEKYLTQSERIMDTIMNRMSDPTTGWILETFDKELKYQAGKADETEINIGHNIEVAWTLLLLHMINQREAYRTQAKALADRIHQYGFNASSGVWYATIGNQRPEIHSTYSYWWIQAYGQMFDLCLARLYPEGGYVDTFSKGARFWDAYFLDKQRGDTYLGVTENGVVTDDRKANQFKASYHNMEHCLLNSLYLSCWIHPEPVTLYFKITECADGEMLYPLPIETLDATIREVRINEQSYTIDGAIKGAIKLPALKDASISVTLSNE
jgi:mannose/cellobiose epimerase-like protein (N-acyl-D-glucosamine 2-epimerase family)